MRAHLIQPPVATVADVANLCVAMCAARAIQLNIFAMPRFVISNTLIVERPVPVVQSPAGARLDVGNKAIITGHALPLCLTPQIYITESNHRPDPWWHKSKGLLILKPLKHGVSEVNSPRQTRRTMLEKPHPLQPKGTRSMP
jgi:hypothetical protein